MNIEIPSERSIAILAIVLGLILCFYLNSRSYNRMVGISQRRTLPFFLALLVGLLEWMGVWLYRLLILFGVGLLLILWYNST